MLPLISETLRSAISSVKNIRFGRSLHTVPCGSTILFPLTENRFHCGLAGLIAFKPMEIPDPVSETIEKLQATFSLIEKGTLPQVDADAIPASFFGGDAPLLTLLELAGRCKTEAATASLFADGKKAAKIAEIAEAIHALAESQTLAFKKIQGSFSQKQVAILTRRLDQLKDAHWQLAKEVLSNITSVQALITRRQEEIGSETVSVFRRINTVLNSIDILEVRGRDSSGISVLFVFDKKTFEAFRQKLQEESLYDQITSRTNHTVLENNAVSIHNQMRKGEHLVTVAMTYKIAAEIGSLGDNVRFLRNQIKNDALLQILAGFSHRHLSVAAHTRWASVGEISVPNCHPQDNTTQDPNTIKSGIIHVALNGDIDNYRDLKKQYENRWDMIPEDISTDTKIIPVRIEHYLREGHPITEAFRLAVGDFEGSHAIWMQTDLAPDKLFLAQRGSGQAIFIGIAEDHYIAASEVYGFVETTQRYLKVEGEKVVPGKSGDTQGQIFILDAAPKDPVTDIVAMQYDGTKVVITEKDLKTTEITSRDIDRQAFAHYFLKEISESPESVSRTLQGRWQVTDPETGASNVTLAPSVVPDTVANALQDGTIRRIFFIGQGTAGIAGQAGADLLQYYLHDPAIQVRALKASELSGFQLSDDDDATAMADALVIAISQSGTTTDTNRSVDMVRARGARTIAIVNRRDSDLTFKVDGVLYTSSGRDIEMSVASTKAFYSQIIAGALLGLHLAGIRGRRNHEFITSEIRELVAIPEKMRRVLAKKESIAKGARRLAVNRTYWAAVGSGPNKNAADEIRIKLSELCYRTISTDYVEDKKHIDLSSEPLILVCAAGTRSSVIGDIIKDTAIFHAHKALPVVVAEEGDHRFDPYASQVISVPGLPEHLSPLLTTLAGHIWGYYAALAIHDGSRFLFEHRRNLSRSIEGFTARGMDVHDIVNEKTFREEVTLFGQEFRKAITEGNLAALLDARDATDLLLLTKYLSGRLPISDFELDFGVPETAKGIMTRFFNRISDAINQLSRPVDAIKHQAKTVTVGTSRITEKVEGLLFDTLGAHDIRISQVTSNNILVLRNLQGVIDRVNGALLYRIGGLNLLGDPNDNSSISVVRKTGQLATTSSRTETDNRLKGSKRIIVKEGNVFIGRGKKDGRKILVIPVMADRPNAPRIVEYLLSLDIDFKTETPLFVRVKALGGKFERIRYYLQEYSVKWDDRYLDLLSNEELFGMSAEKIVEEILDRKEHPTAIPS